MLCPRACYVFEMNDIYGDGLGERGFFKGELDGVEIFSGSANFGGQDVRRFCVPDNNANEVCFDSKTLQYKN
jgi:hypothetical protein